MHDFANSAFPHAGVAFSDMHIVLAQAVAGNETALEARRQQINELARNGRYPSGPVVPAVSRGFAAFERHGFSAAIDALEPIASDSSASAAAAPSSILWSSRYCRPMPARSA